MNGVITLWACPKSANKPFIIMAKNEQEDIEIPDEEDLEGLDDSTDWKNKAGELQRKHREAGIRNRERTKALKDKIADLEKPPLPKKSDEKLLERLDKMALQVAGITEADEVELFNKWKTQTAREADDIVGNSIFKKELEDIRTAKANLAATSDIKGEQGHSGVRNTPEYWIAKAIKGADGKLMFDDQTPKELYPKILDKLAESEPSSSEKLKFYNQK